MSNLIDFSDDDEVIEKPNVVLASPVAARGVTVDTRYVPKSNILMHIEGSSWLVNYYSQILNADNAPKGQQLGTNPIYQQYSLIERYEFKVTSALTTSQDNTTKEMTLVGSATIFPFIVPNEGDMFLADVGDGREAVFKITNSERKSIFKDTCYAIDYQLIDYSTEERRTDLNNKVIATYVYKQDFLEYGQNPLVTKKEDTLITDLQIHYGEIIEVYFKSFYSKEFSTLLVPGQPNTVYDPFLTKAIKTLFSSWDYPGISKINILNVDGDNNYSTPTIWDMLIKLDKRLLNYVANRTGLINVKTLTKDPMLEGIYHSGIRYAVYPKNPILDVDYERVNRTKVLADDIIINVLPRTNLPILTPGYETECTYCDGEMQLDSDLKHEYVVKRDGIDSTTIDPTNDTTNNQINGHEWDFSDIIDITGDTDVTIPDIHLVTIDDFYVFASTFYHQNNGLQLPGMSKLECAVCQMLGKKKIDNALLIYFCETYHSWGAVERFYYLPILLILIKYSIRSI